MHRSFIGLLVAVALTAALAERDATPTDVISEEETGAADVEVHHEVHPKKLKMAAIKAHAEEHTKAETYPDEDKRNDDKMPKLVELSDEQKNDMKKELAQIEDGLQQENDRFADKMQELEQEQERHHEETKDMEEKRDEMKKRLGEDVELVDEKEESKEESKDVAKAGYDSRRRYSSYDSRRRASNTSSYDSRRRYTSSYTSSYDSRRRYTSSNTSSYDSRRRYYTSYSTGRRRGYYSAASSTATVSGVSVAVVALTAWMMR